MTTQEVLDAIVRERARLVSAIDALGDGAMTVSQTDEGWTAKDVLAHTIHWVGQIAFGVGAALQPPAYVIEETKRRETAGIARPPTADEWNALAVASFRGASLEAVRAQFDHIVDALVERVRLRSDAEMDATDAIPWAGALPLWQLIGGETFLHWPSHSDSIEPRLRGSPHDRSTTRSEPA